MKINVEIECTPDEARRFMGLPEVAAMQKNLIDAMEARLMQAIVSTDTQTLMQTWLPFGVKGLEQWQSLWTQMAATAASMPGAGKHRKDGD